MSKDDQLDNDSRPKTIPNLKIKMAKFETTWEKITDEDDPRRCQYIKPTAGQCSNVVVEGSQYCPAHGGNRAFKKQQDQGLKNYRLTKFKQRIQELGSSDEIISLRDEIGILRILIEEKVNSCNDKTDLLLMSGPLSDLLMKAEKLVTSCNRLESKLGNLLDRTKVVTMAQTFVQIISKYITDEAILETISNEITNTLKEE